jgi:hypothetical protein
MKQNAYRAFIDAMVIIAHRAVSAGRVFKFGHPVRPDVPDSALSEEEKKLKGIFTRLNDQDRQVLARAFITERQSGIHDFAAFLQEATANGKIGIKWDGQTVSASDSTMQADFIKRLTGGDWEKR